MKTKSILVALSFFLLLSISVVIPSSSEARISDKTTKLIAYYEGWSPCVTNDPAGNASIGYGHLIHLGKATKKDKKKWGCITKRQGLALLKKELRYAEDAINDRIDAPLNEYVWRALISYTYNLGPGYLDRVVGKKRTTNVAARINKGYYIRAAKEMRIYDGARVGKKIVVFEGLTIRRNKEYRLMLKGYDLLLDKQFPTGGVRPPSRFND